MNCSLSTFKYTYNNTDYLYNKLYFTDCKLDVILLNIKNILHTIDQFCPLNI